VAVGVPVAEVVSLAHALEQLLEDLALHVSEVRDQVESVVSVDGSAHEVGNHFAKELLVLVGVEQLTSLTGPEHMLLGDIPDQLLQVVVVLVLEALDDHVHHPLNAHLSDLWLFYEVDLNNLCGGLHEGQDWRRFVRILLGLLLHKLL
jgi:hypothetical protein